MSVAYVNKSFGLGERRRRMIRQELVRIVMDRMTRRLEGVGGRDKKEAYRLLRKYLKKQKSKLTKDNISL